MQHFDPATVMKSENEFKLQSFLQSVVNDQDYINRRYYIADEVDLNLKLNAYNVNQDNSLKIIHLNIRSLNKNIDNLKQLLSVLNMNFDVIVLSEIWAYNLDFYTKYLDGFSFFYAKPLNSNIGGVGIFVKSFISVIERADIVFNNSANIHVESKWLEISVNNEKFLIGGLYRHPNNVIKLFTDELEHLLTRLKDKNMPVILVGDLNIDLLKFNDNKDVNDYLNMIISTGLKPYIVSPTRVTEFSSTLIDHIYADFQLNSTVNTDSILSGTILTDITDHYATYLIISLEKSTSGQLNKNMRRIFSSKNFLNFYNKLCTENWNSIYLLNDPNVAFSKFYETFISSYDNSFPVCVTSKNAQRE